MCFRFLSKILHINTEKTDNSKGMVFNVNHPPSSDIVKRIKYCDIKFEIDGICLRLTKIPESYIFENTMVQAIEDQVTKIIDEDERKKEEQREAKVRYLLELK